jgi:hypothetical protein
MKIAILLSEEIVNKVIKYSEYSNKTDAILFILKNWITLKELEHQTKLNEKTLEFLPGFEITKK